ncbi:hypothetical protein [Butyrivibrio sp. TB]|uniref:hypothetical protein n=1 Tax=Butyrivibrio sp. TB TaxID=1520809 RepID=UPI0008BD1045|nr:hypothetical protein [Butyrivibrio sp. TB]SEQ17870.1 hypothetical protein SAMN02910382_02242 [Butyrivibrio sp. TB]
MRKTSRIIIIAMLMLTFFAIPVRAATTSFTLTVTKDGQNQDPKSKRTEKAGGANWENKFYVTNDTFTGIGTMIVTSINLKDSRIASNSKVLNLSTKGVRDSKGTEYKTTAPSNQYYYLKAVYGSGLSKSLNATGRYTP